ncbi:hypothetical protein QBC47DRAFT_181814 [Echria macrotheca]|uniref:Uncharacterized protein n=1 Tax=Echria macrotheca TaxID=438768 RepID=A0AAJ0BFI4_9PEZI|nr:hypothetical protein QBC47DRAFT_181814 [Echria macrotheca]
MHRVSVLLSFCYTVVWVLYCPGSLSALVTAFRTARSVLPAAVAFPAGRYVKGPPVPAQLDLITVFFGMLCRRDRPKTRFCTVGVLPMAHQDGVRGDEHWELCPDVLDVSTKTSHPNPTRRAPHQARCVFLLLPLLLLWSK